MNPLNNGLCILLALAFFFGVQSCTDPTALGAELLDEDQANVGFSDTVTINAFTIATDTVRTYSPGAQLRSYLFGNMTDPIFGQSNSDLYLEARLSFLEPDFLFTKVDSIILVLPYDTAAFYGKWEEEFGIDIFELTESMDREADYNSDATFMTDVMALGSYTFTPNIDTLTIVDYSAGASDTVGVINQLRLPLDPNLGTRLIRLDTTIYESDSAFVEEFKGIHLKPTLNNNGILAFDLFNSNLAGIYVYYTKNDTVPLQYHYQFNPFSAKVASFEHDLTGTIVQEALDAQDPKEEFLFVQGMAGVDVQFELPDLSYLKNTIINKAELEITVAPVEGDDVEAYDPISQFILSKDNDSGDSRAVIEDIEIITLRGLNLATAFGGTLEEGEDGEPQIYKMNIAAYLQNYIETGEDGTLYLSAFPKADSAKRTILYGSDHPDYGIKLKIAYTEL